METDLIDIVNHYDEIQWPNSYRITRRYIRDNSNPFDIDVYIFQKLYRFTQESVYFITNLIRGNLTSNHNSNKGLPVSPEICVLVALRTYATASFQTVCGELYSLSQPTISRITKKVSECLAKLIHQYVKFPQGSALNENRQLFNQLGEHGRWPGLSEIDGALDCTHIKIVSTPGCFHHEAYRNRKRDFSINTQVIVGPRMEVLDIVAKWAGSTHDSRILQMSTVYMRYQSGELNGRLVGDNGYPLHSFLLTPILDPTNAPSMRYNRAQIKSRNIVERFFGIWKRRFPCLRRGLANKLQTVSNIIVSCAVLHNISLLLNDILDDPDEAEEQEDELTINNLIEDFSSGLALRNSIIQNYYT